MDLGLQITSLYLENFIYLESGLKKDKLFIDLSGCVHPINVLIGKIGSGKTFILSHLQPFATVGTLDIRNQDDPIIAEKNGLKIICYKSIDAVYEIRHEYIWNKSAMNHSTKSYIRKNGEEINPTGNVTSFKYIINTEFGLDQANMRLLRLGPNVSGFLEYSGIERKNFVAQLLESADSILALNKSLREELRTYNTRISILSDKLAKLGVSKEEDYENEIEDIHDRIKEIEKEIESKRASIIKHNAEIALVAPNGYESLMDEIESMITEYDKLRTERDNLQTILLSLQGSEDVETLMKRIGALENEKSTLIETIKKEETNYDRYQSIIIKTSESIQIIQNDEHLRLLRDTYQERKCELEQMESRIRDFECRYSSSFLKNLITDLHSIDVLISDLTQYDPEVIRKCYLSDGTIISWANHQGEILSGRKVNLQKKMNNISFSATYSVQGVMYVPPYCPTKDCPYRKSHPYTLSKDKSTKQINHEIEDLRNQIETVDKDLSMYALIPSIYTKTSELKEKFRSTSPIVGSIGCLLQSNLIQIITRVDKQRWYDYDKIIDTQELALVKESYYESLEQMRRIEEEMKKYETDDLQSLQSKKREYEDKAADALQIMQTSDTRKTQVEQSLKEVYSLYQQLLEKSTNESRLADLNSTLDAMTKELTIKGNAADKIGPYAMVNDEHKRQIELLSIEREGLVQKLNQKTAILNDLKYTKDEMKDILLEQKYLTHMVDATSSKEGIPLQMVNDFVKNCKDIANDLTFDIFEEDIQLENFDIDEKGFFVPFSINGKYVQDITKASQGQRSLFNIAIAFAFIQEMHLPYNIPLMDEVDAPLHKPEQSKFLSMVLHQMKDTGSRQAFLITHNSLENLPVNFLATTEEDINLSNGSTLIKLYE